MCYPAMSHGFLVKATFVIALSMVAAAAGETGIGQLKMLDIGQTATVNAVGDAKIFTRMTFPGPDAYREMRALRPTPESMARYIANDNSHSAYRNAKVTYDDPGCSAAIDADLLGMARIRRDRWEIPLDTEMELIHADDRVVILNRVSPAPPDTIMTMTGTIELPTGAGNVRYDKAKRIVSYTLPRQSAKGERSRLGVEMTVRPNLMSAMYKIYGEPGFNNGSLWAAKTLLRNEGDDDITDVRVRYRIGDYAPWSPDARYDLIPPGGTVVDCYYPLFAAAAMDLPNAAPTDVEIRYTYRDSKGVRHEDGFGERTRILGRNAFEFSALSAGEADNWGDKYANAPLLAAFVTRMDPLLREFAGIVAQASGGAASASNDSDALDFCRALHAQIKANGIVLRNPAGFLTDSAASLLDMKYPRDVLREKSATALELAILYAAVCDSTGLDTGLAILPGRSLAVVKFPSGQIVPLDVSAGESFEAMLAAGQQAMPDLKPGQAYLVDVRSMQRLGVIPPELPPLPAGALTSWGITRKTIPVPPAPAATEPPSAVDQSMPPAASPFAGRWVLQSANGNTNPAGNILVDMEETDRGASGKVTVLPGQSDELVLPTTKCSYVNGVLSIASRFVYEEGDFRAEMRVELSGRITGDTWDTEMYTYDEFATGRPQEKSGKAVFTRKR